MVKTPCFHCRGCRFDPWGAAKKKKKKLCLSLRFLPRLLKKSPGGRAWGHQVGRKFQAWTRWHKEKSYFFFFSFFFFFLPLFYFVQNQRKSLFFDQRMERYELLLSQCMLSLTGRGRAPFYGSCQRARGRSSCGLAQACCSRLQPAGRVQRLCAQPTTAILN